MKYLVVLLALSFTPMAFAQPAQAPLPPGNTQPKAPIFPLPGHPMPPAAAFVPLESGATKEFNAAMEQMMANMSKPYTGDPDRDFLTHMLPHHQAAIDMAETELKYGHDPKVKELAARIISAQQHEIAVMQTWLAKHPLSEPRNPHIQWK
jgi:hypothetical protein